VDLPEPDGKGEVIDSSNAGTAHGIMTGDVFELDGGIGRRHENWNHSMIRESEQKNFI
jgi:hypothetical protein